MSDEVKNARHAYVSGEAGKCATCGGLPLDIRHSQQPETPFGCLACGAGDGEYHRQGCSRLRELDEAVRRLSTPPEPARVSPAQEVPTPPAPTGEPGDPAQGSTAQASGSSAQADWRDSRPTNIGDTRVLDDLGTAPSGTFDIGPSRNMRDIVDLQKRTTALEERATTLEAHAESVGAGLSRCEGSVAAMTTTHADRIETIEDEVRSLKQALLELRELNSAQAFGARHAASQEKLGELFDEVNPRYEARVGHVVRVWEQEWIVVAVNADGTADGTAVSTLGAAGAARSWFSAVPSSELVYVRESTPGERKLAGLPPTESPATGLPADRPAHSLTMRDLVARTIYESLWHARLREAPASVREEYLRAADATLELLPPPASETTRGAAPEDKASRPRVVCLCGSTRFHDAFVQANERLTLEGKIVLSVGSFGYAKGVPLTEEQKVALDELHRRKIDLCDEVLVLNVGGYIGESTRGEVQYAWDHGKPVTFLEPINYATSAAAWGKRGAGDVTPAQQCPSCHSTDRFTRLMYGNINDRYPCRDAWHIAPAKPGSRTVRLLADVPTPDGVLPKGTVAWVSNWDATTGRAIVISTRGGEVMLTDDQWEAMP